MKVRNYSFKDVVMLLASRTIAGNFLAHILELGALRTNWDENYAKTLLLEIDGAIDSYLGMDKRKELKEATSMVNSIQITVTRNLSSFKTQVFVDFPEEASRIIRKLGYPGSEENFFKLDQESLKKTTKQVTGDVIDNLNAIYHDVSGICKIARSFYRDQPLIQEQFVFSGIVDSMDHS